ncbi:MAG: hypothetical protein NWE84_03405 [Candidatus Bathyarchaeota archaeon]|nr:hypothetical protein [Candidatus Bathyarchaeota archaeon]
MELFVEVSLAGIALVLSILSWKTLRKIKHLDVGKSFWIPIMLSGIFFFAGSVTAILSALGYFFAYSIEFASISRLFALCILLGGVYTYSRQISRNLAEKFIIPTYQTSVETDAEAELSKSIVEKSYEKKPAKEISCPHELGYLKTLPKNSPIPKECLSCRKIIECKYSYLTRKPTEPSAHPESITEFISLNAESEEETSEV